VALAGLCRARALTAKHTVLLCVAGPQQGSDPTDAQKYKNFLTATGQNGLAAANAMIAEGETSPPCLWLSGCRAALGYTLLTLLSLRCQTQVGAKQKLSKKEMMFVRAAVAAAAAALHIDAHPPSDDHNSMAAAYHLPIEQARDDCTAPPLS